ncbi:MAG: hypothetical protein KF851_14165 [Pirellulaceae bacterium]|nr:hypothetical protein [Pirellulaceae bacterium]
MKSKLLRESFRSYAGDEKYRRFIRALNTASQNAVQLRYWQDVLWTGFASTVPDCPCDYSTIQQLFAVCELHDCDLLTDTVLAPYSQLRHSRTQSPDTGLQAGTIDNDKYPYPGWPVSPDDWPPHENKFVDVLYCPKCRELRAQRERENET